jgi:hypothetical protein
MERIIVDTPTLAKLGHLREQYEICDASGRLLGQFFPVADRTLYDSGDRGYLRGSEQDRLDTLFESVGVRRISRQGSSCFDRATFGRCI